MASRKPAHLYSADHSTPHRIYPDTAPPAMADWDSMCAQLSTTSQDTKDSYHQHSKQRPTSPARNTVKMANGYFPSTRQDRAQARSIAGRPTPSRPLLPPPDPPRHPLHTPRHPHRHPPQPASPRPSHHTTPPRPLSSHARAPNPPHPHRPFPRPAHRPRKRRPGLHLPSAVKRTHARPFPPAGRAHGMART